MVTYREFVEVFAEQCGGGAEEAAPFWNDQKEVLRGMSKTEVRERITCP